MAQHVTKPARGRLAKERLQPATAQTGVADSRRSVTG
jgi:hypothetical protein